MSLSVGHQFAPGITWNTAFRSVFGTDTAYGYDTAGTFLAPAGGALPSEWIVQRRARQQNNIRTYNFLDTNISLPFSTWSVKPVPSVQALFGYAYTDAVIDRSNSSPTAPLVGARLTNSSLDSLSC